jgi:hypothetical protein
VRTPKGPLPGGPLTESPQRYFNRATSAPGSAPYFDHYSRHPPAAIPDDATIEADPAASINQAGNVGYKVPTNPTVVIRTIGGDPIMGVPVRFAIGMGQGRIASASVLTGVNGEATAGAWHLDSPGEHSLQAVAGPLALRFTATAS